jgi:hypothetical protein
MKKYLLVIVALVAFSCSEDKETVYRVDESLSPYVDAFISAAADRGVSVERTNLIAEVKPGNQSMISIQMDGDQRILYFDSEIMANTGGYNAYTERAIFHDLARLLLNLELEKDNPTVNTLMNPAFKFSGWTVIERETLLNQAFQ